MEVYQRPKGGSTIGLAGCAIFCGVSSIGITSNVSFYVSLHNKISLKLNFYSACELKKEREARIYDAAGVEFPIIIGLGCGKCKTLALNV